MSNFPYTTRSGLAVSCDATDCHDCLDQPVTPAAVDAAAEEAWFDELTTAVEEYLQVYVAHRDAPKSERDDLAVKVHEAKRDVITRFYAKGMGL